MNGNGSIRKWIGGAAALMVAGTAAGQSCEPLGWSSVDNGPMPKGSTNPVFSVNALTHWDDGGPIGSAIYAGGNFWDYHGLACWDGTQWSMVGGGIGNGSVLTMTTFDDGSGSALYIGGSFGNINYAVPMTARGFAKWDGSNWSMLGTSSIGGNNVRCMQAFNDGTGPALYVGGGFSSMAGVANTRRIAKWNGTTWSAVGGGMASAGNVNALTVFDDGSGPQLYAAGNFTVGSTFGMAKWNGMAWVSIGPSGPNTEILTMTAIQGGPVSGIYVGGTFTDIGGVNAQYLARWDGSQWMALPSSYQGVTVPPTIVRSLSSYSDGVNSFVFVGGEKYYYVGAYWWTPLLRWDGTNWQHFSSGVQGETLGGSYPHILTSKFIDVSPFKGLYIGGLFNQVGLNTANNLAHWRNIAFDSDHNINGREDSCDFTEGTSLDCNGDLVPDECQRTEQYRLDDGHGEVVWFNSADYLWLNAFTVRPHAQVIDYIDIPWSRFGYEGGDVQVLLYDDPNNDGNPIDAVLLASATTDHIYSAFTTEQEPFSRIRIKPTHVGNVGDTFFVGAFVQGGLRLATADTTAPLQLRSWSKTGALNTIDINNLALGNAPVNWTERNWMLRALSLDCNNNRIPDLCDIEQGMSNDANMDNIPDECQLPCSADISPQPYLNGLVNIDDLVMVIVNWGQTGSGNPADITHDDVVNIDDLVAVITTWGPCP